MTETHVQDNDDLRRSRSRSTASRPLLATVLASLCVLTLVAGLLLTLWVRSNSPERPDTRAVLTDNVDRTEQDRLAVIQAAQKFTETFNNFSADKPKDYIDRVAPLLSTKFRTDFTGSAEDVITGITQQRLSSKGKVLVDGDGIPLVGVASLDADSAQVLVASDAQRVDAGQSVLRHWRWQVSLVKVDGTWLVDSFKEV